MLQDYRVLILRRFEASENVRTLRGFLSHPAAFPQINQPGPRFLLNDDIHAKREYDAKTQVIVTRTKKTFIFPRYHQLAVVRALLKQVRDDGPGQNYLVEHSAGNGKSNSIAWLAYRLSSSYRSNEAKERIFDPVIVVTDRRVLDRQLTFTDTELEKLYVYTAHLMEKMPGRKSVLPRQVLSEVDLDSSMRGGMPRTDGPDLDLTHAPAWKWLGIGNRSPRQSSPRRRGRSEGFRSGSERINAPPPRDALYRC